MFGKPEVLTLASALAGHAAARQMIVARNVANADTPGYRASDLPDFSKAYRENGAAGLRHTRVGHLHADPSPPFSVAERSGKGHVSPNGNSVSLETEMVKAAETRRDHDMALAVYGKSISILRASLGRV
ncbi:MAG: FlgB family protein [Paracoccaceae bacterium]